MGGKGEGMLKRHGQSLYRWQGPLFSLVPRQVSCGVTSRRLADGTGWLSIQCFDVTTRPLRCPPQLCDFWCLYIRVRTERCSLLNGYPSEFYKIDST